MDRMRCHCRNIPADVGYIPAQAPYPVALGDASADPGAPRVFRHIRRGGIVLKVTINDIAGVVVLISAVAISCVWLGLVSNGFTDRKTRVTYIGIANTFNVALSIILSVDILMH